MAVLASILPVVSRSSALALELFKTAAESPEAARELVGIANKINGFASILKQVGTIIKEDDRLPSPEAFDALDDVIEQSQNVLSSFESAASIEGIQHHDRRDSASSVGSTVSRLDSSTKTRSEYLMAHLDALSTTLSVLLQTLYTAQSIMWSKLRPTVSPQQAARVVDNEKLQLETLIIQQQLSILLASDAFQNSPQSDSRLLMEDESSQSLIVKEQGQAPKPSSLYSYQNKALFSPDTSVSNGLSSVCKISAAQAEQLLHRWTCLPQFERRLQEEEYEQRKQRQQAQQATVESDSEEEYSQNSKQSGDGVRRSRRSGSVQPLFTENNMPSPESEKQFGPRAPPTPADTPHTSQTNISTTSSDSSLGSPPVNAAAAVEAKEEDDEADLEIPWKLCTRKYYWRFIDAKQVSSNTDQPSSLAFAERNSWTEIMASWVCKEAIQEARLPFTQVQKERRDGRRTKFETCFCITKPLQFDQVNRLVERTVEMYRKNAPPTPPAQPKVRTSSFHRQPPPSINAQKGSTIDRSRTPITRSTHPPLDCAKSSINLTPPGGPPPLDRSMSTPGPGLVPPLPQAAVNSRTPSIQIPVPPGQQQYGQQFPPPPPHSPRHPYYPQQSSGYPSQPSHYYPPPPPYPTATGSFPPPPPHPYLHASTSNLNLPNNHLHPMQALPRRSSYLNSHNSGYPARRHEDNDTTTSDSESERPRRSRRERDRSRAKYGDNRHGKKSHGGRKTAAAGALLGVGGLTALLDGLSGL